MIHTYFKNAFYGILDVFQCKQSDHISNCIDYMGINSICTSGNVAKYWSNDFALLSLQSSNNTIKYAQMFQNRKQSECKWSAGFAILQ